MTNAYLQALVRGLRLRLAAVQDGSADPEDLVAFLRDEIWAVFSRGELMALRHLTEKATSEEVAPSPSLTVWHSCLNCLETPSSWRSFWYSRRDTPWEEREAPPKGFGRLPKTRGLNTIKRLAPSSPKWAQEGRTGAPYFYGSKTRTGLEVPPQLNFKLAAFTTAI